MMRLLDFLFPPRTDEKLLREASLDNFLAIIAPKIIPATRPETAALLPFSNKLVRGTLHEAKYHGSPQAFAYLGAALAEYLTDLDVGFTRTYLLVPVPLGRARRKERGFNQAEEIAKEALHVLHTPERFWLRTDILKRARETPTQIDLPREKREANMREAFLVVEDSIIEPAALYIVIDDVITTGATLQAAIEALKAKGAKNILPIALAH